MTDDEVLPELPPWDGTVIEVVPRGTRPVGDAGEGGTGVQQEDGANAEAAPAPSRRDNRRRTPRNDLTDPLAMRAPSAGAVLPPAPMDEAQQGEGGGGVGSPPPDLPPVEQSYMDYRAERADQQALEAVRSRVQARRRGSGPIGQRIDESDPTAGMFNPEAPGGPQRGPATDDASGVPRRDPNDTTALRLLRGAGAVVRNAAEIPGQIVTGTLNATREVFRAGDELANWLNENVADLTVTFPLPGVSRDETLNLNPTAVMAQAVPEGPEARTPTGAVTREGTQFLVGFLRGAGLLSRLGVMQGAGRGAQAARGITAGAISDFFFQEADEANLSRAWRDAGLPENALTDFLATDPEDNAALNRLRRAVEGGVVGGALDGILAAARAARAGLAVRRAQEAPAEAAPAAARPEPRNLNEAAGVAPNAERDAILTPDPNRPLVEARLAENLEAAARIDGPMSAAQLQYAGQVGARPEPSVYVNWGRINTPDDVQAAMRDMAEAFQREIDEARRGVQTNEETSRLADMLGMTVADLLERQRGQPFNAETALAARRLYTASGEALLRAAEAAAAGGAGALEMAAFRRMMAVHASIQAQVIGARTETARALQSWAIPAGSGREQMRMIEQLMQDSGGIETAQAMARRMALLARNLPPEEVPAAVGRFANRGWGGATIEAIQDVWINALLSSPATHAANIAGNTLNIFLAAVERGAAARVAGARGAAAGEGIMPGEAAAMVYGVTTGFRDALRMLAATYRDGGDELGAALGKTELPRDPAVTARAFGVDEGSGLGRAIDFVGHQVIRAPGRAMGAEDAFFKSLVYRAELHAASMREAYGAIISRGEAPNPEALGREMARIMRDPPEHIRIQAADMALYTTFNREAGPFARRLMGLRNTDSPAANLAVATVLPFVRTPMNILSYSFERTPLAPLVGQWRADVAAGGARRDLALGRTATGSMLVLMAVDMAERGLLSGGGPDDANERTVMTRQGVQPYSVRVGDTWLSLNRLDPFGFLLGAAADISELVRRADIEPEEVNEISELYAAMTLSVSRMVADRSFFTGVARFAEAISGRNPNAEGFIAGTVASLAAPGIVASVERAVDPVTRDAMGIQQMIEARIAGLSSNLIPRRNVWGDQERPGLRTIVGSETAADIANAVTPVRISPARESPIDRELQRLNFGISPITRRVSFEGVEVNMREFPGALDRYRQLSGNGLRLSLYGNRGFRDALTDMIEGRGTLGEQYAAAPDFGQGSKAGMIAGMRDVFRAAARDRVLEEYPDLADHVRSRTGEAGPRNVRSAVVPGTQRRVILAPVRGAQRGTSDADAYDGPERFRPMEMR
jgi:hypothetical protein